MRFLLAIAFNILCKSSALAASGGMVGGGKSPPVLLIELPELELSMSASLYEYDAMSFVRLPGPDLEGLKQAAAEGLSVTVTSEDRSTATMELGIMPSGHISLSNADGISAILVD